MKDKLFKIGEGKELIEVVDVFENAPWWIRWNFLARLVTTFGVYRRYIDVMDADGNVKRIYENVI